MQLRSQLICGWNVESQLAGQIEITPDHSAGMPHDWKFGKRRRTQDTDDVVFRHWSSNGQADLVESQLDRSANTLGASNVSRHAFADRIFYVAVKIETVSLARHRG